MYNIITEKLHFEWDDDKDKTNRRKHRISFEEAKSVFYDKHARLLDDPDHSLTEDRFILLGLSAWLKILVVCHCYHQKTGAIRIISARKATKTEQKQYKRD